MMKTDDDAETPNMRVRNLMLKFIIYVPLTIAGIYSMAKLYGFIYPTPDEIKKDKSEHIKDILKTKTINAIRLDIRWSDLGSWKEILLMFKNNKSKYFKKKNVFYRPWGSYTNLFYGNNFLIKELNVNSKGVLSLQKHFYRSEHWVITQGNPKITLNNKTFLKKAQKKNHLYQ